MPYAEVLSWQTEERCPENLTTQQCVMLDAVGKKSVFAHAVMEPTKGKGEWGGGVRETPRDADECTMADCGGRIHSSAIDPLRARGGPSNVYTPVAGYRFVVCVGLCVNKCKVGKVEIRNV